VKRNYPVLAVVASLFYIAAVIVGGALRQDYSHLTNSISELSLAGAPNKTLLDMMFGIYNIALVAFGVTVLAWFRKVRGVTVRVAAWMMVVVGVCGGLMFFFRQDPRGTIPTFTGTMHLVLAGVMSPLTVILILLGGLSLGRLPGFGGYRNYSVASSVVCFVSGLATAVSTARGFLYMGLLERITIGSFIIWLLVTGIRMLRLERT
jgi:hypothetical protein